MKSDGALHAWLFPYLFIAPTVILMFLVYLIDWVFYLIPMLN